MESPGAKFTIVIIAIVAIIAISAVIIMNPESGEKNKEDANSTNVAQEEKEEEKNIDYMANAEKQLAMPEEGETVAIMHVKDYGDIKLKFFADKAPKAVENFLTHAKEGYYNGVTFHRVMEDFMIQGGDPEGTGAGGESIWGEGFGEEIDDTLVPYRGSLCMASTGFGNSSIGSQFFITQAKPTDDNRAYFNQIGINEKLMEAYEKYGGYMSLNGYYTVFGQVYEGMDVVDKIAKTEVEDNGTGEMSSPVKKVVIESIDVEEYKK